MLNPHLNDLPLFEGQLLVSCVGVGRHGQRIVVKEGHKDPEGLLGLGLVVVRGGAAVPVPVAILNTWTTKRKVLTIILHHEMEQPMTAVRLLYIHLYIHNI